MFHARTLSGDFTKEEITLAIRTYNATLEDVADEDAITNP